MGQGFCCRRVLIAAFYVVVAAGCTGVQTYPSSVRSGETVTIAMGWQKRFARSNTTVTITPSFGDPVTYLPGDPAVRAIINLYPDPASELVVIDETLGSAYGYAVNTLATGGDRDWYQTTAYIDLPDPLSLGAATIDLVNTFGDTRSTEVQIVGTGGTPAVFDDTLNGVITPGQLKSLERFPHYEVAMSGGTGIPYALEVLLSHDPSFANGGLDEAYLINTRGDLKSMTWSDNAGQLKVLLISTRPQGVNDILDFKFYVITGKATIPLELQGVQAFDMNGEPITGVMISINSYP